MTNPHLTASAISFAYPDRTVLTDIHLTAPPGKPVALIGENGSGKTTLLRILAGDLTPDAGTVKTTGSTGLLHQELPYPETATITDVIEAAVAPIRQISADLETAAAHLGTNRTADEHYSALLADAETLGLWELDAHIATVLAGLNIADLPPDRPTGDMSGGQRSRLALAALLLARPDTLLLDEPTNHLDTPAADFLADQLSTWPGAVIFTSHDRVFLDHVAKVVVDLDPTMGVYQVGQELPGTQGLSYTGNYSEYLVVKTAAYDRWCVDYATEQEHLNQLRHEANHGAHDIFHTTKPVVDSRIAKKFMADKCAKTVGRRVKNARKRVENLERTQVAKPPAPLTFTGLRPSATTSSVTLECVDVAVTNRLRRTTFKIPPQGRLLITGGNGSGKSTLLKTLTGQLTPDHGTISIQPRARIGMLAQDITWPEPHRTVVQLGLESAVALGLLNHRDLTRPIGTLSVGQQRRVALAALITTPPDVLILDEPTNHLSLTLCEELETAWADYPGIVIIASHDRWLRNRWTGETLHLASYLRTSS